MESVFKAHKAFLQHMHSNYKSILIVFFNLTRDKSEKGKLTFSLLRLREIKELNRPQKQNNDKGHVKSTLFTSIYFILKNEVQTIVLHPHCCFCDSILTFFHLKIFFLSCCVRTFIKKGKLTN